jgi:adenosylmethionine-8-amino-7-oxononanoate aminotransferase
MVHAETSVSEGRATVGRTAFLHGFSAPASDEFLLINRGEGAAVFDAGGRRYVDALASLWYSNIGHGRADVADAVAKQMRALEAFTTFDRFTNEPAEALAERLRGISPVGGRVFFTNSGSEAVETAIKLARLSYVLSGSDRNLVVSRERAYHGVTYGGLSAQGIPENRHGFGPFVQGFALISHHDADAVERFFRDRGTEIALVLAEPVIAAGGVIPPPEGYLERLRELCDEYGALLCFDEVVCGFGRLGGWWGADHYGVRPDLVTFAKGVTSGYLPLGGVIAGPRVVEPLEGAEGFVLRHGHTFSGHPAACAAGLTVVDILEREGLLFHAPQIAEKLGRGLSALAAKGIVAAARGAGAVWAVDVPEGRTARSVRLGMERRGVIARPLGERTIAFCPPLVIGDTDLDLCVDALAASLEEDEEIVPESPR